MEHHKVCVSPAHSFETHVKRNWVKYNETELLEEQREFNQQQCNGDGNGGIAVTTPSAGIRVSNNNEESRRAKRSRISSRKRDRAAVGSRGGGMNNKMNNDAVAARQSTARPRTRVKMEQGKKRPMTHDMKQRVVRDQVANKMIVKARLRSRGEICVLNGKPVSRARSRDRKVMTPQKELPQIPRIGSAAVVQEEQGRQFAQTSPPRNKRIVRSRGTTTPTISRVSMVRRRPATALEPIPLPELPRTFGAARGWLLRQGKFATNGFVLEVPQVSRTLQWKEFFFVCDPDSRLLLQFKNPYDNEAMEVVHLENASIFSTGWKKLGSNGEQYYTITIVQAKEKCKLTLAIQDEKRGLRWLQVLRSNSAVREMNVDTFIAIPSQNQFEEEFPQAFANIDKKSKFVRMLNETEISSDGQNLGHELEKCGLFLDVAGSKNSKSNADSDLNMWRVVPLEVRAAEMIQRYVRVLLARKHVFGPSGMRVQNGASNVIQRFYRKYKRQCEIRRLNLLNRSALTIQGFWRKFSAMKAVRKMRLCNLSAKRIQGAWRSCVARTAIKNLQRIRFNIIQECLDEMVAHVEENHRRHAQFLLECERYGAACGIQRFVRRVHVREMKKDESARFIQSRCKTYLARSKLLRTRSAAISIQKSFRGFLAKTKAKSLLFRTQQCIKIQKTFRGWNTRTKIIDWHTNANTIIRFARCVLAKNSVQLAKRYFARRESGATKIVSFFRMLCARKTFLHVRTRRRVATKIQSWFRKLLALNHYAMVLRAVETIQHFARRIAASNFAAILRLQRRISACRKVQKWFREWLCWRNLIQYRERLCERFCKVGEEIYRGAFFLDDGYGPCIFARVTVRSRCGDLMVSLTNRNTVGNVHVKLGSWYVVYFITCVWCDRAKCVGQFGKFGKAVSNHISQILVEQEEEKFDSFSKEEVVKRFIPKSKFVLPAAFTPVSMERAHKAFWKQFWRSYNFGHDDDESTAEEAFVAQKLHAFNEPNAETGKSFLDKNTSDYAFAETLVTLGRADRTIFANARHQSQRRLVALRSMRSMRSLLDDGPCCEKVVADAFVSSIIAQACSSKTHVRPSGGIRVALTAIRSPFLEEVLQDSVDLQSMFEFDFELYDSQKPVRNAELSELYELEEILLKSVTDEAFQSLFDAPIQVLQTVLEDTRRERMELMDDSKRWKGSIESLRHERKSTKHEHQAKILGHKINYLVQKCEWVHNVLKAYVQLIERCTEDLMFFESAKQKMMKSRHEIRFLVGDGRCKRREALEKEKFAADLARPLFQKGEDVLGKLMGALLVNHVQVMSQCERALKRYFPVLRYRIADVRVITKQMQELMHWQKKMVGTTSSALASFTTEVNDRIEEAEFDRLDSLAEVQTQRDLFVERVLTAESELAVHQADFDKQMEAEAEIHRLIEEEAEQYRLQMEYEEANRPPKGFAGLNDLEEEISFYVPFDLSGRVETLHKLVKLFCTKEELLGFEVQQVQMAVDHALKLDELVESDRNFILAEMEAAAISKRLSGTAFLFKSIQKQYATMDPEELDKLKRHGENPDDDDDDDSAVDFDDFSDIAVFAREVSSDADYVAVMCREYCKEARDLLAKGEKDVPYFGDDEMHPKSRGKHIDDDDDDDDDDEEDDEKSSKSRKPIKKSTPVGRFMTKTLKQIAGEQRTQRFVQSKAALLLTEGTYASLFAVKSTLEQCKATATKGKVKAKKALTRAADPFKWKELRRQEAAVMIQRHVRGFLCRKRLQHLAAMKIQNFYRSHKARKIFLQVLYESTVKYYDLTSGRYYYVWPGGVSWAPPAGIADQYIRFGKRRRPRNYEWCEEEAATLLQSIYRQRKARMVYIETVFATYEKVYEPSHDAYFYQNLITGKCTWTKPIGLGDLDLIPNQ